MYLKGKQLGEHRQPCPKNSFLIKQDIRDKIIGKPFNRIFYYTIRFISPLNVHYIKLLKCTLYQILKKTFNII